MDKLIFLDIDGVLNCQRGFIEKKCDYVTDPNNEDFHYQAVYPPSKKLINQLIDEIKAKVVISSTWRHSGLEWMRHVWELEGMSGEIIDITPSFRRDIKGYTIPRGCEIDSWLESKKFYHCNWSKDGQYKVMSESKIENYIIIDDDSDMLYHQRKHFIHVLPSPRNIEGFNEENYLHALNILKQNVVELNF